MRGKIKILKVVKTNRRFFFACQELQIWVKFCKVPATRYCTNNIFTLSHPHPPGEPPICATYRIIFSVIVDPLYCFNSKYKFVSDEITRSVKIDNSNELCKKIRNSVLSAKLCRKISEPVLPTILQHVFQFSYKILAQQCDLIGFCYR